MPGDPVQLQEVLLSLLVNASEAISAAGDGPRDITVGTAVREAGLVEISIGDTGIGVEEAEMERIFEHFVSTKQDGLGIGTRDQPVDHPGARRADLGDAQRATAA